MKTTLPLMCLTALTLQAEPLVKLTFDGSGPQATNTGSTAGAFPSASFSNGPSRSTNTAQGSGSIDFGTTPTTAAVEFQSPLPQLHGLQSFTLTGWLNLRSLETGSGGNRVISTSDIHPADGFDLVVTSSGSLKLGINQWPDSVPSESSNVLTASPTAEDDNWTFFAVTYDSFEVGFYFGNKSSPATLDKKVAYPQGALSSSSGKLTIGHFPDGFRAGAASRMFRGLLDDMAVWSTVLTLQEITEAQGAASEPSDELEIDLGKDLTVWTGTSYKITMAEPNWNYSWITPDTVFISDTNSNSVTLAFWQEATNTITVNAEHEGKVGSDSVKVIAQDFKEPLVNSNLVLYIVLGSNNIPHNTGLSFRALLTNYWGAVKVEKSKNMIDWQPLVTLTNQEKPYIQILDLSPEAGQYMYRASKP